MVICPASLWLTGVKAPTNCPLNPSPLHQIELTQKMVKLAL